MRVMCPRTRRRGPRSAVHRLFFVDDDQRVTLLDIGHAEELRHSARQAGAEITELELSSQLRCNGSDGYLAWLDDVLAIRPTANRELETGEFDFRVVDDPNELHRLIEQKNRGVNRSRVVAGQCRRHHRTGPRGPGRSRGRRREPARPLGPVRARPEEAGADRPGCGTPAGRPDRQEHVSDPDDTGHEGLLRLLHRPGPGGPPACPLAGVVARRGDAARTALECRAVAHPERCGSDGRDPRGPPRRLAASARRGSGRGSDAALPAAQKHDGRLASPILSAVPRRLSARPPPSVPPPCRCVPS